MRARATDRKSTRLNSSHDQISYAVFCLKKKNGNDAINPARASGNKVDARERIEGPHSGDPQRSCRWLLDHLPSGLEKREAWPYRNISLGRTHAIQRGRKTCQRGHRTSRE